jgi:hypothetical protein
LADGATLSLLQLLMLLCQVVNRNDLLFKSSIL